MRRIYRKFFFLIGIFIFIFLVFKIGTGKIIAAVLAVDIRYLAVATILVVPIAFLQTYKWSLLLRIQRMHVDFGSLIKIAFIGWFYGFITPGKFGAFIRVFYLKEITGERLGKCTSNVLIDRIVDFFVLLTFATFGSILLINYFSSLFSVLVAVFVILIAAFLFFMKKERSRRVLQVIYYLLPSVLRKNASETFDSFYKDIPRVRDLGKIYLIGIFSWIVVYTQIYIVARGFSVNVPYLYFILIFPIATIISLLPITIGGIGTREASLIVLFSIFNVPPETVVAFSLTGYILSELYFAGPGAFFAYRMDKKRKAMGGGRKS